MRLTKFNEETGKYELIKKAKTQEEFMAQRKAVIQRLGKFEDMATRYMAYSDGRIEMIPTVESVRADTVGEMHFEIQQRCIKGGIYPVFVGCVVDKVAYEMTGDESYIAKFRMED
jgi:hypothetical protein